MFNQLIKIAASQGIWTLLSIVLIIYIIQVQKVRDANQQKREENYINLIKDLVEKEK
ncbi:hypothetical protein HMPREF1092_03343 [Clostridium thermobutyricum]|uniref:Uncharacterized protein n=1 Tax=Clostridium thermobutyricum TaxID=29372 RepID=N9XFF1_9CLOT|nr:BhlA/UviB family holin-like peptide [Clostridium thermobutyricum]ENY98432.1 hypothetical protein HMPREF1092_03343 [Clostridium thermobutyricum]